MATTPAQRTRRGGTGAQAVPVRLAGGRPVAGAHGAVHGGQHQPAGRDRGRAGRCRSRSSSRRSACCSSPTRSSGCASTTSTRGRCTRSSARRSGRGPGVVAGWGLAGTYVFYAVTTAGAAGIFGRGLLDSLGVWKNQPTWAPMLFVAVALALALLLAALPARGGTNVLLIVEVCTVALILVVTVVVLVKLLSHSAPGGSTFTWSVFSLAPRHVDVGAVPRRGVRLPVVRRVRGVADARRGGAQPDAGHPAGHPRRGDLRRHLLRGGHRRGDDGLRHLGQGARRVRVVAVAARRPRHRPTSAPGSAT